MKIKLKRLHSSNAHVGRCYNNYRHDSSKSLYGYKNFRIRTDFYAGGWYVEEIKDSVRHQISNDKFGMTFKEAKKWLENFLQNREVA
jgi:hypothetical protein